MNSSFVHPKRLALSVLLVTLGGFASQLAYGQHNNEGSLYSRFGLGQLEGFSTSQSVAMGSSGYGSHSLGYVNFSNPGSWSDQILTRVAAGFTYQTLDIVDAAGNQSRLASGFLNSVQFGIPVIERRVGVAVGFAPFSRVGYGVQEPGQLITTVPEPDTVDYTVSFEGSGGLQQIVGGLGYRLNGHVSVGASVHGFFGIIDNGRRTSFIGTGSGPDFVETNVTLSTRLTGITATIGTVVSANRVLGRGDLLTLGLAFTLPTSLTAERVRTLGEELDRDTLGVVLRGDVDLPWRLVGGATYHPDNRWTLSAGGRFEPWTDFRSDLSFPGIEPGSRDRLSDFFQIGAGVEFLPAGSDLLAPYLSRIAYRLGFYHDRSYVSPSAGERIETTAIAAGLSLPALLSGTRIDINVEVGRRGSTDADLVRDTFYRLSANVNIGERWFQKPKLR